VRAHDEHDFVKNWPKAIQTYIRESMPIWKTQYEGVEEMTLAVMGCIVMVR